MEDRIWKLPPFECDGIPLSQLRQRWLDYKKTFRYAANAIAPKRYSEQKWKSIFLALAGPPLQRVYESLPEYSALEEANNEEDDEGGSVFEKMLQALDRHFAPKRHDAYERDIFWSMKPRGDETLDKFLLRAQAQARLCKFGSSEKESQKLAVMDKVMSQAPLELRKRLLERAELGLDEMTRIISSHLSVNDQNRDMNQSTWKARDASSQSDTTPVNRIARLARLISTHILKSPFSFFAITRGETHSDAPLTSSMIP